MLGPDTQELILRTERFHARVARLDKAWRMRFAMHPSAIHRLRDRLQTELRAL
jgi:regulator of CtrA degradation